MCVFIKQGENGELGFFNLVPQIEDQTCYQIIAWDQISDPLDSVIKRYVLNCYLVIVKNLVKCDPCKLKNEIGWQNEIVVYEGLISFILAKLSTKWHKFVVISVQIVFGEGFWFYDESPNSMNDRQGVWSWYN